MLTVSLLGGEIPGQAGHDGYRRAYRREDQDDRRSTTSGEIRNRQTAANEHIVSY